MASTQLAARRRKEKAEADLAEFRRVVESRDELVRRARRNGVNVHQIHLISGISRNTVYAILAK